MIWPFQGRVVCGYRVHPLSYLRRLVFLDLAHIKHHFILEPQPIDAIMRKINRIVYPFNIGVFDSNSRQLVGQINRLLLLL